MWKQVIIALALLGLALGSFACGPKPTPTQQREASVKARTEVFANAEAIAPLPQPQNFPLRQALVEFTLREDLINHPWYTYILGQNGNVVGYYVTKTVPISTCNFLSSTEVVDSTNNGKVVLTAPSLDGIYYGGAGASANCGFFFFDYATNAMISLSPGVLFFSSDQPLRLEAAPILVETTTRR